ncbi:MAG: anhydro-N-acetylmuramic acid kinase [Nitrospinaceae bacterium]|jgi:anhydro-N-acetylmuramic acid kinase|nr:anhydro-N-acetylmuramic acid kinase [Nitrospinaceae bacterium]MBT3433876.1 anhydro-N-acetylmuramic acid kinase [Nitrospinaceae bacterium]MBT4429017.1 anhydro-N-acetylmuramic acid kinase [Nitrospinaceae bacterium]MBT6395088.1 anhydro-N-acetylmuramic acid kinase [Nitrospinaceae bacterium]
MNVSSKHSHTAIGLMSGTSADGVDAALISIPASPTSSNVEVLEFKSYPYSDEIRRRVLEACGDPGVNTEEICSLHREVGEVFAEAALAIIKKHHMTPNQVDFMGSHGQTVRHLPKGGKNSQGALLPSTLQIGDPSIIAEKTGSTIISDFRSRDVAAGGMGAPLTPWAHRTLFENSNYPCAFLNLGGISNITYIPPSSEDGIMGFDAGPANMALDTLANKISGGKAQFDLGGEIAARGQINEKALASLMEHPYLKLRPPKSTGRETFGETFLSDTIDILASLGESDENQMATLTAFSARCIIKAVNNYFPTDAPPKEIIAGGGGVHNKSMMRYLQEGLDPIPVVSSAVHEIDPNAVEAVSFALLAWATLRGEPANIPAATGASHAVVLGNITPGKNYLSVL